MLKLNRKKEKKDLTEMNIHTEEISIPEYLIKFSKLRTALSDFYVKTRSCRIIGAAGDEKKGFLLAEQRSDTEILFITAEDEDPSVKKALLDHLTGLLPSGSTIRWRIIDNPGNEKAAAAYGFQDKETVNIFRTVSADNETAVKTLREYEKLYVLKESLGYRTVSFEKLSEGELSQIRNNSDGEFDPSLHPERLMDDISGGFSPKMSFASVKDGKVIAYTGVRDPLGKSCIFELICVAESERKNGLFILPFYRSLREIIASGAESALFSVYESNSHMMTLVRKWFSQLIASHSIQHNMEFTIP